MGGTEWCREESLKKKTYFQGRTLFDLQNEKKKMFPNQVEEVTIKRETRVMYFFL